MENMHRPEASLYQVFRQGSAAKPFERRSNNPSEAARLKEWLTSCRMNVKQCLGLTTILVGQEARLGGLMGSTAMDGRPLKLRKS